MSEEKQKGVAKGLAGDAKKLPGRLDTYLDSAKQTKPSLEDMHIIFNQSANSVIDGLGADIIRLFLEEERVQELVDNVHMHSAATSRIPASDEWRKKFEEASPEKREQLEIKSANERKKLEIAAAKIEAKLKGFDLPLKPEGDYGKLNYCGLEQSDHVKAMAATQEAVVELANQQIPKQEYADRIIAKTTEILNSQGISDPKYVEFISQGKKNPEKYKGLSAERRNSVKAAISESVEVFNQRFKQDAKDIENIEVRNVTQQVFKDLDKNHNNTLSKEASDKLLSKLAPELQKLGPEYLKNNKDEIASKIAEQISSKQTTWSKMKSTFSRAVLGKKSEITVFSASMDSIVKNVTAGLDAEIIVESVRKNTPEHVNQMSAPVHMQDLGPRAPAGPPPAKVTKDLAQQAKKFKPHPPKGAPPLNRSKPHPPKGPRPPSSGHGR